MIYKAACVILNEIMAESADPVMVMRILARDGGHVRLDDRDALIRGADELESARKWFSLADAKIIEAQQELAAAREKIAQLQKPAVSWTFGLSRDVMMTGQLALRK
jgi:hypothetical protein